MERLNPTLLDTWYELTESAKDATLNQSLELEMKLALSLGSSTELQARPLTESTRPELAGIESMHLGQVTEDNVDYSTTGEMALLRN